jgi:hypothetical protein
MQELRLCCYGIPVRVPVQHCLVDAAEKPNPTSTWYSLGAFCIELPAVLFRLQFPCCYSNMSTSGSWVDPKEKELRMGSRDKRVGWYTPTLENVSDVQRDLLETYSNVQPDRVIPHILEVVRAPHRVDLISVDHPLTTTVLQDGE